MRRAADVARRSRSTMKVRSSPVGCCVPRPIASASAPSVRALPRAPNGRRAMTRGASSSRRQQMAPPRVGVALVAASAGRRSSAWPSVTARITWPIERYGQHRRVAAVMVARQIPIAGASARRVDGDAKAALQRDRRRQQLAPHPHQGRRAGKRRDGAPTRRRRISASRPAGWRRRRCRCFLARRRARRRSTRSISRSCSWSSISSMRRRNSSRCGRAVWPWSDHCGTGGDTDSSAASPKAKKTLTCLAPASLAMPCAVRHGLRGQPADALATAQCIWRQRHRVSDPDATSPTTVPDRDWPGHRLRGDGAAAARLRRRRSGPSPIAYQTYGTLNAERSQRRS